VESILAFRLAAAGQPMGALNMYSTKSDAFDDHDVAIGAVFATHAAVAWSRSRTAEDLRIGMRSRELIGKAIGILMARQHISEAEALDVLTRASQRLNVKLRLIAEQIVRPEGAEPPRERSD
jgi:GAF domain-containing protein